MGLFGGESKSIKTKRKVEREKQSFLASLPIEEAEAMKARIESGQLTETALLTSLGAPGTYGPDAATITGGATPSIYSTTGELAEKSEAAKSFLHRRKYGQEFFDYYAKPRKGILDPEGMTEAQKGTATFRIMSQLTAESEQMLNEKGDLFQAFRAGITNPIIQAGAQATRESLRFIKDQAAKGGTARRAALQEAQTMLAIEAGNTIKAEALWKAEFQLRVYTRDRARQQVFDNQSYVAGLVRPYTEAFNQAGAFLAGTAVPVASNLSSKAYQLANGPKNDFGKKLIIAGISMVAAKFGGPIAGQMASSLAGSAMGVDQGGGGGGMGGLTGEMLGKTGRGIQDIYASAQIGDLFGGREDVPTISPGGVAFDPPPPRHPGS